MNRWKNDPSGLLASQGNYSKIEILRYILQSTEYVYREYSGVYCRERERESILYSTIDAGSPDQLDLTNYTNKTETPKHRKKNKTGQWTRTL